jgi:uncharacterized membrane protein HdeD (DUF308 family)
MMQQVAVFPMAVDPRVGEELKHHWRRFVVLGAALIVLGVVALGSVGIATITSVLVFGWILVVAGILETIHAWRVRGWSGFTRHLLGGVLSFVVGGLIVANPAAGTLSLTLLMAAFFIVGGVFRIGTALSFRFPGRGWAVAGGIVTVALGTIIATEWPVSAVWVIGTFVGIDLIFDGWSLVMAGLGARGLTADDRDAMPAPLLRR